MKKLLPLGFVALTSLTTAEIHLENAPNATPITSDRSLREIRAMVLEAGFSCKTIERAADLTGKFEAIDAACDYGKYYEMRIDWNSFRWRITDIDTRKSSYINI